MTQPPSEPLRAIDRIRTSARRAYVLAVVVLLGSLLMVWTYARTVAERERQAAETEFVAESNEIAMLLQQRLLQYDLALRGGVSLYWSVDRPTARQWRDYVGGLDIGHRFSGLMGLGYAPYLRRSGLELLQLQMRDEGRGLFQIRPHGVREVYGPILYLEPQTIGNQAAVGYDMFSEPLRQEAMAAARDSGDIRMSAPVRLLQQGNGEGAGLLMYAPIYANGIQPGNMVARRTAIVGWVYAPFGAEAFVHNIVDPFGPRHAIRIADVGSGNQAGTIVYRDADFDEAADALRFSNSYDVYGRKWRIDFQSGGAPAGLVPGSSDLRTTVLAGVVTSLLLFAVLLVLAHTQGRAERLAAAMSESYRRSEQRFRSAMQYSASGIALLDRDGRIVEANPALADILGISSGALAGTLFSSRFVESAGDALGRSGGEGPHRVTWQLRRSDGDIRLVQLVHSQVPGDPGSDVRALVQVDDVTDRLRAERQVRDLNRTLEVRVEQRTRELTLANHELESFAYSVSHDLRAPLRTVEGFGRVLTERFGQVLGEDGRGYLSRVRNAATRMDELIDALLKMSRITREPLRHDELDLSRIAAEVAAELAQGDPARRVEVVIEPGLRARGDAALVRNLLQNLLGNAWKFTAGKGDARIEFAHDAQADGADDGGALAAFLVRDNGAGFEPAYASKLFRPFQRLHSGEEYEGHGIGLATVKRIVERHGGTIRAEGQVGSGATFRFTLPRDEAVGAG
ncbi:MAG: CHASE domain-containing protein [Luteimonas sp.]|nr:CHASE domain-containing protein [Luteimonas sp.]